MKLIATRKADQNKAAIDPWTVVHLGVGLAAGLTGVGIVPTLLGAAAYEVGEQISERTGAGQKFFQTSGPETAVNVGVDTAVLLLGWWLGRRYNKGK